MLTRAWLPVGFWFLVACGGAGTAPAPTPKTPTAPAPSAAVAPPKASTMTAEQALERLFSADSPSADWFAPSFLAALPIAKIQDITKQIRDIMLSADVKEGILLVNSLHTTCALFVNEFQGALVEDLKMMLERLVAEDGGYKHDDPRYSDCERGNASSHLRAALLGRSVAVGISGGELSLGRFQSILFAELDGPRPRSIDIQIMGV